MNKKKKNFIKEVAPMAFLKNTFNLLFELVHYINICIWNWLPMSLLHLQSRILKTYLHMSNRSLHSILNIY